MEEVVIIPKGEFDKLPVSIAKAIHDYMQKGYGFKMISRETGEEITDVITIMGIMSICLKEALFTTK